MTARYVADEAALREVVFAHLPNDTLSGYICGCGAHDSSDGGWADHLAASLLASGVVQPREDAVREAKAELAAEIKVPFRSLAIGCIATVKNEPYPDDPRWTPWSRFVAPYLAAVHELLAAALTPTTPGTDRPAAEDGPRNTGTGSAT